MCNRAATQQDQTVISEISPGNSLKMVNSKPNRISIHEEKNIAIKGHNVNVNIVVLNCQKCVSVSSVKSQVTSLKDCSLRVFSKCHANCGDVDFLSDLEHS